MANIKLRRENYGQENFDWEKRVDHQEIREDRLSRFQEQMREDGVDALLLYDPWNIRMVTNTSWLPMFTDHKWLRYCLVTQSGEPTLFENPGIETEHRQEYAPWIADHLEPSITWQYSGGAKANQVRRWADSLEETLDEHGLSNGVIGVDRLDIDAETELRDRGWTLQDGWPTIYAARQVNSKEERKLIDQTASIADAAFARAKEAIEPGVRERDVVAEISDELFRQGCECIEVIVVASGNHTKPYLREFTDKKLRFGENVIIDFNAAGPGGYYTDYVRNFIVGGAPDEEQKQLYAETYNQVYDALEAIEPGATTAEVAEAFPEYADDDVGTMTLVQYGHGVGVGFYEPPVVTRGFSMDYPQEIKAGMQLSLETYVEGEEGGARAEEQVLVTEDGVEIVSLHPHENELLEYVDNDRIYHPQNKQYWRNK
jgi:Xaa-Pro dipeptidase